MEVAFINPTSALAETARLPFLRPYPAGVNIAETRTGAYLRSVEISGPHDPTGPGQSPSRDRVFTCHPTKASDEATCAKAILTTLARRAYRRPVTDADVEPLLAFYSDGRKTGGFDEGVEWALKRLLVGPSSCFGSTRSAGCASEHPHESAIKLACACRSSSEQHSTTSCRRRRRASSWESGDAREADSTDDGQSVWRVRGKLRYNGST